MINLLMTPLKRNSKRFNTLHHYCIITGAIKGFSGERVYKELGLESLCDRRWYRKLVFFYKIVKGLAPSYLQSYLLPDNERTYNTRSSLRNTIKTFATQTSTFRD